MGPMLPLEGSRPVPTMVESVEQKPYRATVVLFFYGGADTFNMLVPSPECALWQEYVQVRDDIALTPAEISKISTTGQACSEFGLHRSLSFIKELYDSGSAAFMSNIGSLVEPLTQDEFKNSLADKCIGLFSHSHQQ